MDTQNAEGKNWMQRHWKALSWVIAFFWELAMALAFQNGLLAKVPNGFVFACFLVPLLGLFALGCYLPWVMKLRKERPRWALVLLLCGLVVLALAGCGLFRFTHPTAKATPLAEGPTNAPAPTLPVITNLITFSPQVLVTNPPAPAASVTTSASTVSTIEKKNSDNASITVGGDNNGNIVQNSPGATVTLNPLPKPQIIERKVIESNKPDELDGKPAFKTIFLLSIINPLENAKLYVTNTPTVLTKIVAFNFVQGGDEILVGGQSRKYQERHLVVKSLEPMDAEAVAKTINISTSK